MCTLIYIMVEGSSKYENVYNDRMGNISFLLLYSCVRLSHSYATFIYNRLYGGYIFFIKVFILYLNRIIKYCFGTNLPCNHGRRMYISVPKPNYEIVLLSTVYHKYKLIPWNA